MRKEENYIGKRVMNMEVDGKRMRRRTKRRLKDCIHDDLKDKQLGGDEYKNCKGWKCAFRKAPLYKDGKS
jgi:hypothetical protein